MPNKVITLDEFIIRRQNDFPFATGDLSKLLRVIGFAAKVVNREVNKAGLVDILGSADNENVQGEVQQKLDVMANEEFIEALKYSGKCCGIASEENEEIILIDNEFSRNANYVVAMDPLDGSSNIDVNVSIGTIFSIYRKLEEGKPCEVADFLQPGTEQVAAGYIIYGSSTMLVYTTGNGVNGFTLDPSIGEFCLSHSNMQIPPDGRIYSINQGNFIRFDKAVQDYLRWCEASDAPTNRPYNLRYIGSMVADIHRNLIKGGIFIYPATHESPNGKLRLLYECNPMAFIMEQAGGKATDGRQRILELTPEDLHQRTPVVLGPAKMVACVESFMAKGKPAEA